MPRLELTTIVHLSFHVSEERLHLAVVDAVAFAGHALDDVIRLEAVDERRMLVLPSLVRVEDKTIDAGMCCHSRPEHPHDHVQIRGFTVRVADDLVRAEVLDRGEVDLAFTRLELRHIRSPDSVRFLHVELSVQYVLGDLSHSSPVGGILPLGLLHPWNQIHLLHEPADLLVIDHNSFSLECKDDASEAVDLSGVDKYLSDLFP